MATSLAEGFVKLQFNGIWLGQNVQNTFWYGFVPGSAPTTFALADDLAAILRDDVVANADTSPGYAAYRKPFVGSFAITGCDIWVKGVAGVELAVAPSFVSLVGSRVSSGDALPANVTASAYAAANRYGQRGSKMGLSGGLEPDQVSGAWVSTADYFQDLCQRMCDVFYANGMWVPSDGFTELVPAVIPRIRAGSPGDYTYRLPIEAADVPTAISVAPWSVGDGLGTANSRKNPIR